MKVSIIIPIYKVEQYIKDCLRSVLDQTYKNIEIILVNDCTPDNSMQIAKSFIRDNAVPNGIEVVFIDHKENKGLSAARNTGINAATGDYIYFLDSDDEITPDCISLLASPLKNKEYDFVIGEYKIIGSERKYPSLLLDEGKIVGNNNIFHQYCIKQFYMMACGKLCNLEFVKKNQLYFQEGIIHEDDLWSLKVAIVANSMYVIRKPTYIYKIRQGSITENESKRENIKNFIPILKMMDDNLRNLKGHSSKDIYYFYDNLLKWKYMNSITNRWRQEYTELRRLDLRPFSYMLKSSLHSKQYFRSHGHRLLPPHIGYSLYSYISKHL